MRPVNTLAILFIWLGFNQCGERPKHQGRQSPQITPATPALDTSAEVAELEKDSGEILTDAAADPVFQVVSNKKKPNFLIFLIDDLDVKLMNQMLGMGLLENINTKIIQLGHRYPNAFVTDSACCPSRASILTGKYPHNHGVKNVLAVSDPISRASQLKGAWAGFRGQEKNTIAKWLKPHGYVNGLVGKYFHGYGDKKIVHEDGAKSIFDAGWDFFKVIVTPPYNYMPGKFLTVQIDKGAGNSGPWFIYPNRTELQFIHAQAAHFIDNKTNNAPFLLYVAPLSPHVSDFDPGKKEDVWLSRTSAPQCIPNGFQSSDYFKGECPDKTIQPGFLPPNMLSPSFGKYEANAPWNSNWVDLNETARDRNITGLITLHQDRMKAMLGIDALVGKILDQLQKRKQLADTFILFTSDNGYMMGEHNLGNKVAPYEESLRIPLFIRYDAQIKHKNLSRDQMILNIDIAPTILNIAGLPWNSPEYMVDGRPINRAHIEQWRQHFLIENWKFSNRFWEYPDFTAIRTGTAKFVEYFDDVESSSPTVQYGQYFDLLADPFEMNNHYQAKIKSNPGEVAKMRCLAKKMSKCKGQECRDLELATSCQ